MSKRRNQRKKIIKTGEIENKTFVKGTAILSTIIVLCIGIAVGRYWLDRVRLNKQREEIQQKISTFYEEAGQELDNVNQTDRDTIITFGVVR